jgi:formylglycine-generating enzyme required for sulfatase activity
MKNASILIFLFLLTGTLPAQSNCDFQKLLSDGKAAAKKENYELALNKFNSARRCDPDKGAVIDTEVEKLFVAINQKKKQADIEKRRAEEQTKIAQAARDSLGTLLQKFEAASAEIVDALVREANNLIYRLDYTAAAAKLRTAADLDQPTNSFRKALAEVAFFWNEAGQTAQAADLLVTAKQTDVPREQTLLGTWLKMYAGPWHDSLMLRYYPNMLPVAGGEAIIDSKKAPVSAFQMARTETTMWQYGMYCEAIGKDIQENQQKSWGEIRGNDPVILVSWEDAAQYANWLSKQCNLDTVYIFTGDNFKETNYAARGYRLPTEVEWEYAARGGRAQEVFEYAGSNDLDSVGWYHENSGARTQPVAGKKANSLGLYDMSGNVWEWCSDWYSEYPATFPANYRGPDSGSDRVLRGGGWSTDADHCLPAYRNNRDPSDRYNNYGFRLALVP